METDENVSTFLLQEVNLSDPQFLEVRVYMSIFALPQTLATAIIHILTDISCSVSQAQFLHDTLIDISRKPDNID